MLGNLASIDGALQATTFLVGKNRPLVRCALKYWWVAVPAAAAIGHAMWKRHKKHDLDLHGVLTDSAPVLCCVAALVAINEFACRHDAGTVAGMAGVRAGADLNQPVKEAEFQAAKSAVPAAIRGG